MSSDLLEQQPTIWTRLRKIFGYAALLALLSSLVLVWMLLR